METPPQQTPTTFSVEQSYVIGMLFFLHLWPLVEPRITEEERSLGTYSLFFRTVCTSDDCYIEWNEAIYRAMHVPIEKQKILQLSLPEIFLCALEFCKLHNERYESRIAYAVHLLESMKEDPEGYKEEWAVWQDAVEQTISKYMDSDWFDWPDDPSAWCNQKIRSYTGE